ncbi:hypothetical protein RIB2604_01501250 [Aspergillus luchuensis]|uniref:Uncharacterized protein n=1 Tax=Aspergillus kawachii TaxID=1069201 RepID=A0A146F7V4_ASPKA|nr:hypothetical protein RIB2604_01501250 [Aspergillus luchuensis]
MPEDISSGGSGPLHEIYIRRSSTMRSTRGRPTAAWHMLRYTDICMCPDGPDAPEMTRQASFGRIPHRVTYSVTSGFLALQRDRQNSWF